MQPKRFAMYHDTEHYRLAFVEAKEKPYAPPELVFVCGPGQFSIVTKRLDILRERLAAEATRYFFDTVYEFTLPEADPDLFGRRAFGYQGCGQVVIHEQHVAFHLPLQVDTTSLVAFTVQLLKIAFLAIGPEDVPLGNQEQQIDIDLCTDNFRSHGYGHALGGYLSLSVTAWLAAYLAQETTEKYRSGDAPMVPAVVTAMRHAWRATARESWQEYVDECKGRIFQRGAFILDCFGNACDVGVYPSEFRTDETSHTISCHNLDTAEQQLTFLAGLAKLCELTREDNAQ